MSIQKPFTSLWRKISFNGAICCKFWLISVNCQMQGKSWVKLDILILWHYFYSNKGFPIYKPTMTFLSPMCFSDRTFLCQRCDDQSKFSWGLQVNPLWVTTLREVSLYLINIFTGPSGTVFAWGRALPLLTGLFLQHGVLEADCLMCAGAGGQS